MSYKTFYEMFIAEMPQRLNGGNDFEAQLEMIRENLKYNNDVVEISSGIFKTQNARQITYWVGDINAEQVSIIVDTEDHGNFRKVVLTSKNPNIVGPPFASDLYVVIKQDSVNENLVFTSDELMSDEAVRLWQRLVSNGYHIAVYDTSAHKYVLSKVGTANDLEQYLGDSDSSKHRFVFVMTESEQSIRGTIHSVAIMELKRNSGYPLIEMFQSFKEQSMSKQQQLIALRKQLMNSYEYMKCANLDEFKQRLQWLSEGMLKNHITNGKSYVINMEEIELYQDYREKREQIKGQQ